MRSLLLLLALFSVTGPSFGEDGQEILSSLQPIPGGLTGFGGTTGYWDCCKPSCSWNGNLVNTSRTPVRSCEIDGQTTINKDIQSGCATVGDAYMCTDQVPFVVNSKLSYGFTAFSHAGGAEVNKCCACMLLEFQPQELQGIKMVVQITNTGGDLVRNQFDLALPGAGVGYNNGCERQFHAPHDGWGKRYGGVATEAECQQLPQVLQAGCRWRFEFLKGVPIPDVKFTEVECPKELINISKCQV